MKTALSVFLGMLVGGAVQAQAYPAGKPIRMIVPYTTGGAPDILGRLFADELNKALGVSVIVENKTGQAGSIGADAVAKSAPDGHTLLMSTTAAQSINQHLYKLPHDPVKDFAAVGLVAYTPVMLVVAPDVPASSLKDLIAHAKANPGKLSFASAGPGTLQHIAAELLKSLAGVELLHVPYKGSGQIMPDLLSGRVSMMFNSVAALIGPVKDGKLRAIAVTRASPAAAGVPTFNDAGLTGLDVSPWYAVFAPARTPAEVVARLNGEINRIAGLPAIVERFAKLGLERASGSPQELDAIARRDSDKWGKLIRDSGIRAE